MAADHQQTETESRNAILERVTQTSTAIVIDMGDGQFLEITSHGAPSPYQSSGLQGLEEMDVDLLADSPKDPQRHFKPTSGVGGHLTVRATDDPIGMIPLEYDDVLGDWTPDGWTFTDPRKFGTSIEYLGAAYEHDSSEAWVKIKRTFVDGAPVYVLEADVGDPEGGIWNDYKGHVHRRSNLSNVIVELINQFDPESGRFTVEDDGGDE